jgi:hypothetical protein
MRKEAAYLLRVWNDGQGQAWRARLEEVRSRRVITFASLEALSTYLKDLQTYPSNNEKSSN